LADIRLALSVDSSGAIQSIKTFNNEVDQIPKRASAADGAVKALKGQFDNFVSGVGIGTGIAAAGKAFEVLGAAVGAVTSVVSDSVTKMLGYSDTIVTISQRTGLFVTAVQALQVVAKASGTDIGSLSAAVVKMEVNIFKGSAAFTKLGLSISELKAMAPDAAFERVASAVGNIEDPMQRAAAAVAIFGKSGAEMLPVFATNLEEAKKTAKDFGLVLGEDMVTSSEAFGDRLEQVGDALGAFMMRIGGVVAGSPAAMTVLDQMGLLFGRLSAAIDDNIKTLDKWVTIGIVGAIKATDLFIASIQKIIDTSQVWAGLGKGLVIQYAAEASGLNDLTAKMRTFTAETMNAVLARAKFAAIDMGGKGVLLPGGSLGKPGGGGFFDGSTGKAGGGTRALLDSAFRDIHDVWVKGSDRLWDTITGKGSAAAGVMNQAANQRFAFDAINGGGRSVFGGSDRLWDSVTNPGKGMLETMFPDYKKQKEASMTASQALQNLANVAAMSGSKLGKGLAGILGGAGGIASGLQGLKGLGGGLTGILGKAGMWGGIAASALSIGSSIFGMFKKKPAPPPPEPPKQATEEAWRSFVGDQQSKGAAGVLAGVSGVRITSEADMAAQASIASQTFWATFKSQGLIKAADAFKGVRDKMLETFKGFGASEATINALLGPMSQMVDLAGNEGFRGAADGANGYAEALASIVNTQMPMSIDQFRAFEQQAVAGFEQMKQAAVDQGMSMTDAIKTAAQGSGQYLQTIKDAAARYSFDLGGSQALFDAAAGAGVAFGGSSTDRLILSVDRLTETLGGAPPKFEAAFSAATNSAGDRIGAAAQSGQAGTFNPSDFSASIVSGIGRVIDQLKDGIASQPIQISLPDITLDGNALASGMAVAIDRGGGGGQRLLTAIEGRAF